MTKTIDITTELSHNAIDNQLSHYLGGGILKKSKKSKSTQNTAGNLLLGSRKLLFGFALLASIAVVAGFSMFAGGPGSNNVESLAAADISPNQFLIKSVSQDPAAITSLKNYKFSNVVIKVTELSGPYATKPKQSFERDSERRDVSFIFKGLHAGSNYRVTGLATYCIGDIGSCKQYRSSLNVKTITAESKPLTRSEIKKLQSTLNKKNCEELAVDGIIGPKTKAAFKRYARYIGVNTTLTSITGREALIALRRLPVMSSADCKVYLNGPPPPPPPSN